MIPLLVAVHLADAATANLAREANPTAALLLIAGLAVPAKLAACALVAAAASVLERAFGRGAARALVGLAICVGLVGVVSNIVPASRSGQDASGVSAPQADVATEDVAPARTGAPVPSHAPTAVGRSGIQSDAVLRQRYQAQRQASEGASLRRSGQSSPGPTTEIGTWLVSGILAHMGGAPVGHLYLAVPEGPGVRVKLCAARCLTLTSTDVGPSLAMQRADRIADVSVYLFERICGLPASRGLCVASMEGPMP